MNQETPPLERVPRPDVYEVPWFDIVTPPGEED